MTAFYSRETSSWFDTSKDSFTWISCEFCNKHFPSDEGSAFVSGELSIINFDGKACCDDCLEDNVDDAWLEEVAS